MNDGDEVQAGTNPLDGACVPDCRLFDDFEDGDYTQNPEWVDTHTLGSAYVTVDPLDPDNSVLKIRGEAAGHRVLMADAVHPRTGFDISADIMATSHNYHFYLNLCHE